MIMQIIGNLDDGFAAVLDPRNEYLRNTKGVLIAKKLVALGQ